LTTPLGQGGARLARNSAGASLKLADGREIAAPDWQTLAREVFGGELPLDELPEWLRGARPARQGVIDGWWVQVADAATAPCVSTVPCRQRRLLPRILEVSRDEVSVRLVIDERNDTDE
jgi:outer membrane biogenesis lipoprotein LolB